jgi:tetratricopeptide (TPR) repeat protein
MPQPQDPKLTSQASWFQSGRRRHHRHHRRKHKHFWRTVVQFVMPGIVIVLAAATGWVLLKVFIFDKRPKPKPSSPAADVSTEPATPLAAEADLEAAAPGAGHTARSPRTGTDLAEAALLDPSEVVRGYSNRVQREAESGSVAAPGVDPQRAGSGGTADLLANHGEVLQKLADRKAADAQGAGTATPPSDPIADPVTGDQAAIEAKFKEAAKAMESAPPAAAYPPATAPSAEPPKRDIEAERAALQYRAKRYLAQGDVIGAEGVARQAIRDHPDWAPGHNILGELFARQGRWDGAVSEFALAIQFDPNNGEYYNNLGLIQSQLGMNETAEANLARASKLDPLNPTILMNCGWHFRKVKRYDEALKYYETALAVDPNHGQAKSKLIQTMIDLGLLDRVRPLIEKELEAHPNGLQPRLMMAFLECRLGNIDGTIAWLRKAEQFTTRAELRQVLEKVNDFDSIKDTPQYRDYLAGLVAP